MNYSRMKHLKALHSQARYFFSPKSTQKRKNMKILLEPPTDRTTDYIGPPHPTSNMRPVQFHIPVDETQTEKEFRHKRAAVLDWNQRFWSQHNHKFFTEKNEYVKQLKQQKNKQGGEEKQSLTPQEMSVFYKQFLDSNRTSHLQYNKEWYKKNISLLLPAVKVAGIRIWRSLSRNKTLS